MDNSTATEYARIALLNLIENNVEITIDTLLYEMWNLFDLYSEEQIHKEAYFRL